MVHLFLWKTVSALKYVLCGRLVGWGLSRSLISGLVGGRVGEEDGRERQTEKGALREK